MADYKQFTGLINNRNYKGDMIPHAIFYGVIVARVHGTFKKAMMDWLIIKDKHKMLN